MAPIWRLGFRPFYLSAAIWFVLALMIWMGVYAHGMPLQTHFNVVEWHAHEMLFGFTGAVIVGFLFTAVRNWTALNTPQGFLLQLGLLVWTLARISNFFGWGWLALIFDSTFFLYAAYGIGKPLLAKDNRRNYLFIYALCGFAVLSSLHHLTTLNVISWFSGAQLMQACLALITIVVTIMAGRVIPMFTKNPLPQVTIQQWLWLEKSLLPITVAWLLAELLSIDSLRFSLAAVLAILHAIRLSGWGTQHTLKTPMLWILHFAYAWLIVGFVLRCCGFFSPMALLLSTHALTAGTVSSLCLGMMARTARGHTGRQIRASTAEMVAFAMILVAAVMRVLLPLAVPSYYRLWIALASVTAMTAFLIYIVLFLPWLCSTRADGGPD